MTMKVVVFFNEKGGTGKTFFTSMFACWLAYKKKEKVVVYDCDFPNYQLFQMRQRNKEAVRSGNQNICRFLGDGEFFKVGKFAGKEAFSPSELDALLKHLLTVSRGGGDGYLLLDLPGRFLASDPAYMFSYAGAIDTVVIPVDSDIQSRSSALYLCAQMRSPEFKKRSGKPEGQDIMVFWNKEASKERSGTVDWYTAAEADFKMMGVKVAKTRVREFLTARRDAPTFGFVRNTVCWPQQNIDRACGYIEILFEEIKEHIDAPKD